MIERYIATNLITRDSERLPIGQLRNFVRESDGRGTDSSSAAVSVFADLYRFRMGANESQDTGKAQRLRTLEMHIMHTIYTRALSEKGDKRPYTELMNLTAAAENTLSPKCGKSQIFKLLNESQRNTYNLPYKNRNYTDYGFNITDYSERTSGLKRAKHYLLRIFKKIF